MRPIKYGNVAFLIFHFLIFLIFIHILIYNICIFILLLRKSIKLRISYTSMRVKNKKYAKAKNKKRRARQKKHLNTKLDKNRVRFCLAFNPVLVLEFLVHEHSVNLFYQTEIIMTTFAPEFLAKRGLLVHHIGKRFNKVFSPTVAKFLKNYVRHYERNLRNGTGISFIGSYENCQVAMTLLAAQLLVREKEVYITTLSDYWNDVINRANLSAYFDTPFLFFQKFWLGSENTFTANTPLSSAIDKILEERRNKNYPLVVNMFTTDLSVVRGIYGKDVASFLSKRNSIISLGGEDKFKLKKTSKSFI